MSARLPLFFAALALVTRTSSVSAQNPNWPNAAATTPADMANPANWPDDPNYGYDINGDGTTCIGDGLRCWTNATGGQWNQWSWMPPEAMSEEGYRSDETNLGSGSWADLAWTLNAGEKSTVIAVLDSGINWDETDLINQYYLNEAELQAGVALDADCMPAEMAGSTDRDGDGFLTMRDWTFGLSDEDAAALRARIDGKGNENGVADPGDLITFCSDDVDDDNNGYTDDISGWDFYNDDNDPSDDTRFGHGTGEARWSAAEANNGQGRAGFCPGCRVLMVRVGDSFIVDVQDYAESVIFSTDSGAQVIQEALGSINHSTFMRRATDYAYDNGSLIIASAADENSFHHNYPGTTNHTLYVHAIRMAGPRAQNARSFLAFNNCTNYGAQLMGSAPGTGCSSEATGVTAGIAGLVVSAARSETRPGGPLDPPLSSEELRQVLLMESDDIWVPESDPDHPDHDEAWYPSHEGWDQRFGFGRINAYKSVVAVREGRIPPEVDIVSPDWFRVLYPERQGTVSIQGTIDARRADSFDYVIEWARGVEPADEDFETLAMGMGVTERIEGELTEWDISTLNIDNGDAEGVHNRYTVTIRIRTTAHYGGEIGDVNGEQRRAFALAPDDTLAPGFPVALGVHRDTDLVHGASGESSPKLADLDGDGDAEIITNDSDGLLHVFQADGTELAGFPVQLGILRGHDPADPLNVNGSRAYASGDVPDDDIAGSFLATPAIGDLDGDGTTEIVTVSMEGDIYVLGTDGTQRVGFPVGLPEVPSADPRRMGPSSEDSVIERGAFASPVLADLDNDDSLEIIIAAFDGQIHVFREDGAVQSGFPVRIVAEELWAEPENAVPSRIMTTPAVGDVNDDGLLDIAFGSNEIGDSPNSGAIHLIHGDGNDHDGGPNHVGWPIDHVSLNLFPLVGRGITTPVALADVDDDGVPELAVAGNGSRMLVYEGVQPARERGEDPTPLVEMISSSRGPLSDITDPFDSPLLNTFAAGSFHDLDQDGSPDFVTGGAGLGLAANLGGGFENSPFSHMIGAWSRSAGSSSDSRWNMFAGFPRRIEDYLFFNNPSSADVDGDGYPEVLLGSGGYYVHAWNACGEEAEGFPKFVGGWVISSVAAGDIDGDDLLEIVVATRSGYLFAFDTDGPADGATGWPTYRHDNHNTGNFESPLPVGQRIAATEALECDVPMPPGDAGPGDAGTADGMTMGDASPDGGGGVGGGADCGCRVAGTGTDAPLPFFLLFGAVWLWRRRR